MRWGYLTHVAGATGAADAYRQTVELAIAAEELGYDSFWVAQHHGDGAAGWLPSPLVLLTAIASNTSTIALGTAVIAAPLEDPRRLAEDAATVDVLAGGRLRLGLGVGSSANAAAAFGRDHADRHRDTVRVIDELLELLAGDSVVPPPADLRSRLWWATATPSTVRAAAARGMGVISGRPDPEVVADLSCYWDRVVGAPQVAMSRLVGPTDTGAELTARWAGDPVLPWATEIITQAIPPGRELADQLVVLRRVATETAPALAASETRFDVGLATSR